MSSLWPHYQCADGGGGSAKDGLKIGHQETPGHVSRSTRVEVLLQAPGGVTRRVPVGDRPLVIGSADCDLEVPVAQGEQGEYAIIYRFGDAVLLRATNSRVPCLINDVSSMFAELEDDDRVTIAGLSVIIRIEGQEGHVPAAPEHREQTEARVPRPSDAITSEHSGLVEPLVEVDSGLGAEALGEDMGATPHTDRRASPRVQLSVPGHLTVREPTGATLSEPVNVVDISERGIGLALRSAIATGQTGALAFQLPPFGSRITLDVLVVNVSESADQTVRFAGCTFLQVSDQAQLEILRSCLALAAGSSIPGLSDTNQGDGEPQGVPQDDAQPASRVAIVEPPGTSQGSDPRGARVEGSMSAHGKWGGTPPGTYPRCGQCGDDSVELVRWDTENQVVTSLWRCGACEAVLRTQSPSSTSVAEVGRAAQESTSNSGLEIRQILQRLQEQENSSMDRAARLGEQLARENYELERIGEAIAQLQLLTRPVEGNHVLLS